MQRFEQNLDRLEALINRFEGGEGGPVSAPASASKPAGGAATQGSSKHHIIEAWDTTVMAHFDKWDQQAEAAGGGVLSELNVAAKDAFKLT